MAVYTNATNYPAPPFSLHQTFPLTIDTKPFAKGAQWNLLSWPLPNKPGSENSAQACFLSKIHRINHEAA